jgi:mono/diheme cytochrome c family protein
MKIKIITVLIVACILFPFSLLAQSKKSAIVNTHKKGPISSKTIPAASLASVTRGKVVYASNCLTCHQVDGSGVPNMNPPLIRTKWVLGAKRVLISQVLKGSSGKVEIDGETFHNTMPPLGAALTDQQIADVLTYIRNSFGNRATAVKPEEVKALRK